MLNKILNWKTILIATLATIFILSSLQVLQAPDKILEDVLVSEEGSLIAMQVKTNLPMRYVDHLPEGPSDFIQIRVRPISLLGSDKNEYMGNETILPGFIEQIPILDVAYEGSVPGGPFISLRFKTPVNFQIKEDPDLEGIMLYFPKKSNK